MANWIIGGIIALLVVLVIVRTAVRMKKGKGSCCDGCQGDCSGSKCK